MHIHQHNAYIYIYIYKYTYTYIHIHIHMHIHIIYIYLCTYTYIHIHIQIYICVYVCLCVCGHKLNMYIHIFTLNYLSICLYILLRLETYQSVKILRSKYTIQLILLVFKHGIKLKDFWKTLPLQAGFWPDQRPFSWQILSLDPVKRYPGLQK